MAYYHLGTYGAAIDLLKLAVHDGPQNPTYHYHLGLAYQKNSDPADARQEFLRALDLKPPAAEASDIQQALAAMPKN